MMNKLTRRVRPALALLLLLVCVTAPTMPGLVVAAAPVPDANAAALSPVPLPTLEQAARSRVNAKPRVPLVPETADAFKTIRLPDPLSAVGVPNYLRALAVLPQAPKPFAEMVAAYLYQGTIAPETKLLMGLRIAQLNNSPYVAAHAQRTLTASDAGRALLTTMRADNLTALAPADRLALHYAEQLTRDTRGVSDADFQQTRAFYNDAQVVELTMTVCFFNYLTRLCEALNLPVEAWALQPRPETATVPVAFMPPAARIPLISDDEMSATAATVSAAREAAKQPAAAGLGIGVANSQRAMLRVPALALTWRAYGNAVRESVNVSREIKLDVSFAVSMANGCRYCTLHQVLGLRRLGVDPAKLMAMRKNDAALTLRERTAVQFARKLTRTPGSMTDADYAKLRAEFGEQGAMEVLLQTCTFNYMNRFTDGLRLPSEDEAIKVYRETYGADWQAAAKQ